jgi:hypothetical protein
MPEKFLRFDEFMKNLYLLAVLFLCGCASATRYSITTEETNHRFVVQHNNPQAFSMTELSLAETYRDLPQVLKLKQPETGIFLLKPFIGYRVGGPIGAVQYAPYTLKIVVSAETITLDFELGREETSQWHTWAPKTEIPKIKASFRSISEAIARSVGGTLKD